MHFSTARISLTGDRHENEDRTEILTAGECVLGIVADGMGGHPQGALAAETAIATLATRFQADQPRDNPAKFLADALLAAHRAVFTLGRGKSFEQRPGTTLVCALAIVDRLWWVNIGDSRAYHLRGGRLRERTRDHTRMEARLAAGEISREKARRHPARHTIEHCLGIREEPPPIDVSAAQTLRAGDTVLLCSDGLWSQLAEVVIIGRLHGAEPLATALHHLAAEAVRHARPHSDNVSAVALRVADTAEPHA